MKLPMVSFFILLSVSILSFCKNPGTSSELSEGQKQTFLKKGQDITSSTFLALSTQLQQAMNAGGIPNAIQYCNEVAMPLTDSLSQIHKAQIKRTSLKARNPANQPDSLERSILMDYQTNAAAGEELQPQVMRTGDGSVAFFAPISMQGLCMSCHGEVGDNILEKDYAAIQSLYPNDQATGYGLGDLRGMWSIRFE